MTVTNDFEIANITGYNILITGGTTGIGRAIALLLLQQGANVIITGQNQLHMDEALQDLAQTEVTSAYYSCLMRLTAVLVN
jgi:short-subunit dehydrogenase involved in D-alanine esterification of teichoic acids